MCIRDSVVDMRFVAREVARLAEPTNRSLETLLQPYLRAPAREGSEQRAVAQEPVDLAAGWADSLRIAHDARLGVDDRRQSVRESLDADLRARADVDPVSYT